MKLKDLDDPEKLEKKKKSPTDKPKEIPEDQPQKKTKEKRPISPLPPAQLRTPKSNGKN